MLDEGREVHGNEAVESNNGGLAGFEGENHVPDGGCIECCKSGAKSPWSPVQNWDCDDVRQAPESTQQEASLCI